MNNAIKYIICAGASLAIGFGAGYCFKHEQDKAAFQKQAESNEQAMRYASESFSQLSSKLYSAEQSAAKIHSSLENMNKGLDDIGRGYTGGPGLPGDPGFGDLFPGPGIAGSSKVGGLDDLFKDKKEEEKK